MVLPVLTIFLLFLYSLLLNWYYRSWKEIPVYTPSSAMHLPIQVSIIIPARNEEKNIGPLLEALQNQHYPASFTEIIVVDDHSTDATVTIVQEYSHIRLLSLQDEGINSYKKKAVETGIKAATGELIITTDADCIPGPAWLSTLVSFYQEEEAVFIAAPVAFTAGHNLPEKFQELDFLVLQGITAAVVHKGVQSLCNGANMAYTRKVFDEVGGFNGIDRIASGDDMLLMHKIRKRYPEKTRYLLSPDAIMQTAPMPDWSSFFQQRIRWASKASFYQEKGITAVLLLVYLLNLCLLLFVFTAFAHPLNLAYFLGGWILKTVVEWPFVAAVARFYKKEKRMRAFFFFQPLHILYTVLSGLLGQTGRYEWKGRKVK